MSYRKRSLTIHDNLLHMHQKKSIPFSVETLTSIFIDFLIAQVVSFIIKNILKMPFDALNVLRKLYTT